VIEVLLEYYDAVFLKAQVASFSQGHYYWLLELPLLVPLSVKCMMNDKQYGIIKSQLLNKSPRGISICIWSRVALPGVSISLSENNIWMISTFFQFIPSGIPEQICKQWRCRGQGHWGCPFCRFLWLFFQIQNGTFISGRKKVFFLFLLFMISFSKAVMKWTDTGRSVWRTNHTLFKKSL